MSLNPSRTPMALRLSRTLRTEILTHLLAAAPNEGVGLVAVAKTAPPDAPVTGVRFFPGSNVDASPTRYTMDPAEVLTALREMEANGWRLGAIVHSHVTSPATPSATDLREAHYPEALMVIVSLSRQPPEIRAWQVAFTDESSGPTITEARVIIDAS